MSTSTQQRASEWNFDGGPAAKRARLDSGSGLSSTDDDQESVYSIQGKETDVVQDSTCSTSTDDTTDFGDSDVDLEVEVVEYELASSSDGEINFELIDNDSSGTEDLISTAEGAIAAALCDSSWQSDDDDNSSSSVYSKHEESPIFNNYPYEHSVTDSLVCVRCKSLNNTPFRFCEKCFQHRCWQCKDHKNYQCFPLCHQCFKIRKTFFPPRPRGSRKRKLERDSSSSKGEGTSGSDVSIGRKPIALAMFKQCLTRLSEEGGTSSDPQTMSQDSGIGSSQEVSSLDFNEITVPEHLMRRGVKRRNSIDSGVSTESTEKEQRENIIVSESKRTKLSDDFVENLSGKERSSYDLCSNNAITELCIMCNTYPKNGIFLHGNKGHMCCCYKCALKTWNSTKRCPICNCKVKNVVQLFTV